MDNIEEYLKEFLAKFLKEHQKDAIEVEGILVFGSALNKKMFTVNSDIDVYLVINDIQKRYRGVMKIEDVEIDYFVNPWRQLKNDFEKSFYAEKKTMLFMLANGKIFKDKNKVLLKLQIEAKKALKKGPPKMSKFQIVNAKYFIRDYLNDIKEEKELFAWQRNVYLLQNLLLETICLHHGQFLTKPKYQKTELKKKDSMFIKLFEEVLKMSSRKATNMKISELSQYVVDQLGGNLSDTWMLESKV